MLTFFGKGRELPGEKGWTGETNRRHNKEGLGRRDSFSGTGMSLYRPKYS